MKILLVSDHYPPFIGGAHRQTQLLAQELRQRGHEIQVATVWHGGLPRQAVEAGIVVHRLKQIRTSFSWFVRDRSQRHQPPFVDPITSWELRQLIDQWRPDLVHSYGWISYSCAAALLGKNIPLLVSARDYAYSCATRTLAYKGEKLCEGPGLAKCLDCAPRLYGYSKGWTAVLGVALSRRLLLRKLHGVHSISAYVQQMMRRDFLRGSGAASRPPIFESIIPSFKETDDEETKRDESDIHAYLDQLPKEPFILFVGALRRVKGLVQLLIAYRQLQATQPLVLIGTVEFDTPTDFPPGVLVLRNFPHRAVMAAWERCQFGVVPSLWPEPLGSVVYEGMSRGKAVIGTTPGGHTDMIHDGETGLLVPAGDVEALAAAMQRLITDVALRERLGRAALERSKLFTAEVAVPQFEETYRELLTRSNGHAAPDAFRL